LLIINWTPRTHATDFYGAAIRRHGPKLRILLIEDAPYSYYDPNVPKTGERSFIAFQELCANCPRLEQLAIAPPSRDDKSDNIEPENVCNFVTSLKQLKNLVSLRLFVYPVCLTTYEGGQPVYDASSVESHLTQLMRWTATILFSKLNKSCPRFVALQIDAFRPSECTAGGNERTFAYLRHLLPSPIDHITAVGRRVPKHTLSIEEPCNDIFDA